MGKDMELGRQVGERIRTLRKAQGVTVERLAEAADISVQYVSDIERGRKNMTIPILKRIVLALHTTADYLLFGRTELGPLGDAAMALSLIHISWTGCSAATWGMARPRWPSGPS